MSLWRVWLADGTTFDPEQGAPCDVPRHPRTVCVSQTGDAGDRWGLCLTGGDWFFYREDLGCWTEHSDMGALQEMMDHAAEISACLAGKYIDRETFKEMWAATRVWIDEVDG